MLSRPCALSAAVFALALASALLAGCTRSDATFPVEASYRLEASVGPTLVCPTDSVDVAWEVTTVHEPYPACTEATEDCRFPLSFEAQTLGSDDTFVDIGVPSDRLAGRQTLRPDESLVVSLTALRETPEGTHTIRRTFPVDVIGDAAVSVNKNTLAPGVCTGGQPAYNPLPLINVTAFGESVAYGKLCLPEDSPHPAIRAEVYLHSSADPDVYSISRGTCTDLTLRPRDDIRQVRVYPDPNEFPPPVSCAPSGGEAIHVVLPPDSLQVGVVLACLTQDG